jgi:hypothetical protein
VISTRNNRLRVDDLRLHTSKRNPCVNATSMKLRFTARSNTAPPRSSTLPAHSTDLKVSSRRHSCCCAASGPVRRERQQTAGLQWVCAGIR